MRWLWLVRERAQPTRLEHLHERDVVYRPDHSRHRCPDRDARALSSGMFGLLAGEIMALAGPSAPVMVRLRPTTERGLI